MTLDWDYHREQLHRLYLVQDKSLPKVMEEMNTEHKFFATKSQYVAQFKIWKWRKNVTEIEWRYINRELQIRKGLQKDSTVYLNGMILPNAKVQKEIRRYVLPTFVPARVPSPDSETIQIRTPGPSTSDASDPGVSLWPCDVESRKRSYTGSNESESRELKRLCTNLLPSSQYDQQEHCVRGSTRKQLQQREYPYFIFQDYIKLLSYKMRAKCQPLLCGTAFQETSFSPAMSTAIISSSPTSFSESFLQHTLLSDEGCFQVIEDNIDCLQVSRPTLKEAYRLDGLYEPLAALLLPFNRNLDTLSNLERLETDLRSWCINIPRRTAEEFESIVGALTGRPQLSADLCFLELIVYLYSNNHLEHASTALQRVVDTVSHDGLKILCGAKIPTFQQFKRSLLMHGVEGSHTGFVERLLHQDSELKDIFKSSVDVHEAVLWTNNLRMIGMLLDVWNETSLSTNELFWGAIPDQDFSFCLTGEIASLLSSRGVNLFDGPDYGSELYCPLMFFLTAVREDDYDLTKHLLSLPQGHSAWKTAGEGRLTSPTPLHLAAALSRTEILKLLLYHESIHTVNYIAVEEQYHGQFDGHYWRNDFTNKHSCHLFTSSLFQAAAATGNMETMTMLREAGSSTNEPAYGARGRTALHSAISRGHPEMVTWLLGNGADPNAVGTGSTEFPLIPLQVAVERNDYGLVHLLLCFNANPNVPVVTSDGANLIEAAKAPGVDPRIHYSLFAASGLRDLPPFVKTPDAITLTNCLTLAVQRRNLRSVRSLLAKGAQVDLSPVKAEHLHPTSPEYGRLCKVFYSETLLHWSIRKKISHTIIQLLVHNVIANVQPSRDIINSLLHEAVSCSMLELVKYLLEEGADVNFNIESGQLRPHRTSALHLARCRISPDLYLLLLKKGASVDARDDEGNTPLLLLMSYIYLHLLPGGFTTAQVEIVVRHLLGFGACLNVPPVERGLTILQYVILPNWHDLEFVKMLVNHGADVNMLACPLNSSDHSTALQIAAHKDNIEVVRLLLEKGADVNLRSPNNTGSTALQCAAGKKNKGLVELLLECGADVNAPASSSHDRGATALQKAARTGDHQIAELLLAKGADVNAPAGPKTEVGGRALCCAAMEGHIEVAKLLLAHGAHINAIGTQTVRFTALELASEEGRLDMVQLLLNHGAERHRLPDRRFKFAMKAAKANFHLGIVSLLQSYRDEALEEANGPRVVEEEEDDEDDYEEEDENEDGEGEDEDEEGEEGDEEDLYSGD